MTNLNRKYYKQKEERLIRIYCNDTLEYLADKIKTNIFSKYAEVKEMIGVNDGKIYNIKYCDVGISKDINTIRIQFNKEDIEEVKKSIDKVFYGIHSMFVKILYEDTFDYYYIDLDVNYLVDCYYKNVINKDNQKDFYKRHIKQGTLLYLKKDTLRSTHKTHALEELREEGYVVITKDFLLNRLKYKIEDNSNSKYINVLVDEDVDINKLRGYTINGKRLCVVGGFTNNRLDEINSNYSISMKCDYVELI